MQKARVLVVDSDVVLSEILKARLEALGFLADSVKNGKEALRVLKTRWVDLVVMDIALKSGVKGISLLNKIKKDEELSSIPVIVNTASVSMQKTVEYLGAELFVPKPYPADVLLEEIKDILTPKILIFGDDNDSRRIIVKKLALFDFHIDIITNISKFFQNILLHRYNLIILQCRIHNNMADKLAFLVRGSAKNKKVPVVVFSVNRSDDMTPNETLKIQQSREQCRSINKCEFLFKESLNKNFAEKVKSYLD